MTQATGPGGMRARLVEALFVAAIFGGSFLLFLVQPMVARMALPRLGGAPAVWNSAMLVYQALLLGGYAYAHWIGRYPPRMQALIHIIVLGIAALWLPIGLSAIELPGNVEPAIWVPWLFGASIGPLFFAIAAQAPLIQRWFSAVMPGRDPYSLYVASNLGSFSGLMAYPVIVERFLSVKNQSLLWTTGYVLIAVLIIACASRIPRHTAVQTAEVPPSAPPQWPRVVHWVALAFVPSGLMLATTTFLTTDIVAMPLLWVLPLGLYLLSFAFAFKEGGRFAAVLSKLTPLALLLFAAGMIGGDRDFAVFNAFLGLALLFMISVAMHARMYALRPPPDRLTNFYLAMSVGGALGGVFSGLVAPLLFDWTYEYPLLILAAGALLPQAFLVPVFAKAWGAGSKWTWVKIPLVALLVALIASFGIINPGGMFGAMPETLAFFLIAMVGFFTIGRKPAFLITLVGALLVFGGYRSIMLSAEGARTRSYFGVYTIEAIDGTHQLTHGTTLHGVQILAMPREPTTYYVRDSGVGRALLSAPELYGPGARVGVVGLGTGTLASYAQAGQHWRFFEIDPAVANLALDPGKFTFLRSAPQIPEIVLGDARLRLSKFASSSLDVLALDAFSSDAVPIHLLTREAFQVYGRVLTPKGLLLVHISNRYLALDSVVAAAASDGGWHALRIQYDPEPFDDAYAAISSDWIAMSRDASVIQNLAARGGNWEPLTPRAGFRGWTDDYASITRVLRPIPIPMPF